VAKERLSDRLGERITPAWELLTKTGLFVSKTPEFHAFEAQLMSWRSCLQLRKNDPEEVRRVRQELVELRRWLRLEGYDLSLADHNLITQGFRNDASLGEGFRRLVLFFLQDGSLMYLPGEANHVELGSFLERLPRRNTDIAIVERHFLWYRWGGKTLVLSGSDTESKEDFAKLERRVEADRMKLLAQLKGLGG
jgi:hypothetical protein